MHTIVFGSNGNIGRRLTQHLSARGLPWTGVTSGETDLRSAESLRRRLADLEDRPVRAALLSFINKHVGNSRASFECNLDLVQTIMERLAVMDTRSLVFFSSVDVYGHQPELPITECSAIRPMDWYALAKFVCERMLAFGPLGNRLTVFRLPGVYGAWDRPPNSVIGHFVDRLSRGEPVVIHGTGCTLRDYVHVDDICALTLRALDLMAPPGAGDEAAIQGASDSERQGVSTAMGVFNVATGCAHSINELVKMAMALARPGAAVHRLASQPDKHDLVFDPSLLRALSGMRAARRARWPGRIRVRRPPLVLTAPAGQSGLWPSACDPPSPAA